MKFPKILTGTIIKGTLAVAALGMAATMATSASATVYTAKAAFDAAHPATSLTNFDSFAPALASSGHYILVNSNPFTQGDVTFSTSGGPGDFYLTDTQGFGPGANYSTAISTQAVFEPVTLSFSPAAAVGIVLATRYPGAGAGLTVFTLYNGSDLVFSDTLSVNDMSAPSFVGFDGLGSFDSVVITPNGFDTIVSVELPATVSVVPEPSSWLLMIAGLGVVGMMLRRTVKGRGGAIAPAN